MTLLLWLACGEEDLTDDSHLDDTAVLSGETYEFLVDGQDTVDSSGQIFRHLLIDDMKGHASGMTDRLNAGWAPAEGDVAAELLFYLEFDDSVGGSLEHGKAELTSAKTYGDIASGKDLFGKLAGNDPKGQHKDFTAELQGWDGVVGAEPLVWLWLDQLDAQAVAWAQGELPQGPDGAPVPRVGVTPEGQDLVQLLDKFLRGAVAFSQASDDYLDDDLEGHGLNSDHLTIEGGTTALEHGWDEGFGYFGASRDYGLRSDGDVAEETAFDSDGDGDIDLLRELSWGHCVNASKRDAGALAPTDFSGRAWLGFLNGRALLAATSGVGLSPEQAEELRAWRDDAVLAWEQAIAASVVHYLNEVLVDMDSFGGEDYDFGAHAKHWSEAKGFALTLQFNPRSPLSDEAFLDLHAELGTQPVLDEAGPEQATAYAAGLNEAKAILAEAYGFDSANLGEDDGSQGW
mgnify:CR=1 FL=1